MAAGRKPRLDLIIVLNLVEPVPAWRITAVVVANMVVAQASMAVAVTNTAEAVLANMAELALSNTAVVANMAVANMEVLQEPV